MNRVRVLTRILIVISHFDPEKLNLLKERLKEPVRWMIKICGQDCFKKKFFVRAAADEIKADNFNLVLAQIHEIAFIKSSIAMPLDIKGAWVKMRTVASRGDNSKTSILVIDRFNKLLPEVCEMIKGLWDEDRWNNIDIHVVLIEANNELEYSPCESMVGRFECLDIDHVCGSKDCDESENRPHLWLLERCGKAAN